MVRVYCLEHTQLHDLGTGTIFTETVHARSGQPCGGATVSEEVAERYRNRPGYDVIGEMPIVVAAVSTPVVAGFVPQIGGGSAESA